MRPCSTMCAVCYNTCTKQVLAICATLEESTRTTPELKTFVTVSTSLGDLTAPYATVSFFLEKTFVV